MSNQSDPTPTARMLKNDEGFEQRTYRNIGKLLVDKPQRFEGHSVVEDIADIFKNLQGNLLHACAARSVEYCLFYSCDIGSCR